MHRLSTQPNASYDFINNDIPYSSTAYTVPMKKIAYSPLMLSIGLVLLVLVACTPTSEPVTPIPANEEPTAVSQADKTVPETDEAVEAETETETAAATEEVEEAEMETSEPAEEESEMAEAETVGTNQLDDEQVAEVLQNLLSQNDSIVQSSFDTILASRDSRFVSVMIELLRASQLGISPAPRESYVFTLERLSGENFGGDWGAWIEWYGGTELGTPPGFTTWKGMILGVIDPGFAEFLNSDFPSIIRTEEIQWGGVRVDGIPALDHSPQIAAADAGYILPDDAVFGMEINGDARAYPLRIMDWHEMANDTIGGVPVSIAYCTLCGAAVAYDGRASDGDVYDFGSSGFLFRSNKLMYDRQTRTLWNQLTGEPVLGVLVDQDVELTILPIVLTSWEDWLETHPDTTVLSVDTGFERPYEPGAAYADYFAAEETMFPVWQRSDQFEDKSQVYALRVNGLPKAYPLEVLAAEQVVNDQLAGTNVVLVAAGEEVIVEGRSRRTEINRVYSAGAGVRAYDRGDHVFVLGETADQLIDESGAVWTITEEGLTNEGWRALTPFRGSSCLLVRLVRLFPKHIDL